MPSKETPRLTQCFEFDEKRWRHLRGNATLSRASEYRRRETGHLRGIPCVFGRTTDYEAYFVWLPDNARVVVSKADLRIDWQNQSALVAFAPIASPATDRSKIGPGVVNRSNRGEPTAPQDDEGARQHDPFAEDREKPLQWQSYGVDRECCYYLSREAEIDACPSDPRLRRTGRLQEIPCAFAGLGGTEAHFLLLPRDASVKVARGKLFVEWEGRHAAVTFPRGLHADLTPTSGIPSSALSEAKPKARKRKTSRGDARRTSASKPRRSSPDRRLKQDATQRRSPATWLEVPPAVWRLVRGAMLRYPLNQRKPPETRLHFGRSFAFKENDDGSWIHVPADTSLEVTRSRVSITFHPTSRNHGCRTFTLDRPPE